MHGNANRQWFRPRSIALALLILVFLISSEAQAYIGPGAGFALISSAFVFVMIFFSVLFSVLFWPVRTAWAWWRGRRARRRAQINRMVIVGLDGLDPNIAKRLIDEGRLPNLKTLADGGAFTTLRTSCPPISPVAWSCFMTGCNPGKHNIYDFLARDTKTYTPVLSSTLIGGVDRTLRLGKYEIPLGKPTIRLLRKSTPFWSLLGKRGILSTVLRVPITFPPEKFNGQLLSGMCVPDLLGTQGTFSFYTTDPTADEGTTGGQRFELPPLKDGVTRAEIHGPPNPVTVRHDPMTLPFELQLKGDHVRLVIGDEKLMLEPGVYSPWVRIKLNAGLRTVIQGIARFLVTEISPHLKLYVSPINLDPEKPALPISHPMAYAMYLAKRYDPYATLGLAEDTWALNEGAIGDQAFLDQAYLNHDEREQMFFDALDKRRRGLVACVFDASDRIQHTFWRYLNKDHPALEGADRTAHDGEIEKMYARMDTLVGKTMGKLGKKDAMVVMSDHGFNDFSRGFNINTWLHQNGYITLKEGADGTAEWFGDVDWTETRAYSLGMTCIYLNMKGREAHGIVTPGDEATALKKEIIDKLAGLCDTDDRGKTVILNVWDRNDLYDGPYVRNAPDLTMGFNAGYRASWDSVLGKISKQVFKDNRKAWSGDHCLDPSVVPGVLFTSFKHESKAPHITDVAPTTLKLLGVDVPGYMEGKPLSDIRIQQAMKPDGGKR